MLCLSCVHPAVMCYNLKSYVGTHWHSCPGYQMAGCTSMCANCFPQLHLWGLMRPCLLPNSGSGQELLVPGCSQPQPGRRHPSCSCGSLHAPVRFPTQETNRSAWRLGTHNYHPCNFAPPVAMRAHATLSASQLGEWTGAAGCSQLQTRQNHPGCDCESPSVMSWCLKACLGRHGALVYLCCC